MLTICICSAIILAYELTLKGDMQYMKKRIMRALTCFVLVATIFCSTACTSGYDSNYQSDITNDNQTSTEQSQYVNVSQTQKFETFINTISQYSGKNIKGYFTAAEWNAIMAELN